MYKVLGHEVMSLGLQKYFSKHSWTNTTLPDFVGALNDAFLELTPNKYGPDFDFSEWCESWLVSSGVNIIEPICEYSADGKLTKLQVK